MEEEAVSPDFAEEILGRLKGEIGEIIVGYEEQVDDFITCLLIDGHLLVQGVPGVAKTTLSKALTDASGLSFNRIQFAQDLLPSDITGHYFYNQKLGDFEMRKGPVFASVVLEDEVNRAPPKTQSALLEAMQERRVTVEGTTFELPDPFIVVATINPIETEGVYPLPEAQMDRFLIRSTMDYLDLESELEMLRLKGRVQGRPKVVLKQGDIHRMRAGVLEMHMDDSIVEYVRDLMRAIRDAEPLELGLSPRGGIHLMLAARAHAYLSGRSYVIPDDVKSMAHKVVDHRIILTPEADLEGHTPGSVTEAVLSEVPIPKGDFGEESPSRFERKSE
ncbi:MAG: MoxR family ATPase [Methanobacteriota archaeon]|nr:MAG: MoxR family ATPase [Euryarchaeota archaeon]